MRYLRILVSIGIVSLLIWCLLQRQKSNLKKNTSLTIVHGTELSGLLGEIRGEFNRIAPPFKDGSKVSLSLTTQHPAVIAKGLMPNNEKSDLWISPSDLFIEEQRHSTKAPSFIQCSPLFETSLGIVGKVEILASLRSNEQDSSLFNLLFTKSELHNSLNIAIPDPIDSATGWASLAWFAHEWRLRGNATEDSLLAATARMQSAIVDYGPSEKTLLQSILFPGSKSSTLILITQDQASKVLSNRPDLGFLPLFENNSLLRTSICLREGLNSNQKIAAAQLITFLHTRVAKDIIRKYGLKEIPKEIEQSEQPSILSQTSSEETRDFFELVEKWPSIQKPTANVFVIDTSASISERVMATLTDELKVQLARAPEHSINGIVSFSTDVNNQVSCTDDKLKLIHSLDTLKPSGGSAVYDGILSGLRLSLTVPPESYIRRLTIITDGDDKNSKNTLSQTISEITTLTASKHIQISLIAVESTPKIDFSDLEQIARASHGSFMQTPPDEFGPVFAETLKSDF